MTGARIGDPSGAVVLFGGTSDIGLAIVRALLADGLRPVVLAGRSLETLKAASLTLPPTVRTDLIAFDAEATDGHEQMVGELFASPQAVDIAILAFGRLDDAARSGTDSYAAVRAARTNYVGALSLLVLLANRMRERRHGTIVVLSSIAGIRVRRSNFVYGSTKRALDGLAQGLGDALTGTGVRVVVVRPGFVRSKMTVGHRPAVFASTPERVAADVIRGLRGGAEVIWTPPVLRFVGLLLVLMPRILFRRLRQ